MVSVVATRMHQLNSNPGLLLHWTKVIVHARSRRAIIKFAAVAHTGRQLPDESNLLSGSSEETLLGAAGRRGIPFERLRLAVTGSKVYPNK